jgi:hypothetical protein
MFGETVKIKDSSGGSFRVRISTPTVIRLSFELWRNGDFRTWRPHAWGGDWKVVDQGSICYSSGEVWYRRSGGDFGDGVTAGQIQHLDIFLYKGGEDGEDDWGVGLRSFFTLNGMTSSGGSGYLDQSWALQSKPGQISWDIPGRYASS